MASSLREGESHGAAVKALKWYKKLPAPFIVRAFNHFSGEPDLTSQICLETIKRLETGKTVSDRYMLGLCWLLRDQYEEEVPRST